MIRLSIVTAARNAARFLPEALASIAPALGSHDEIEVVLADGASSDETVAIATADPRVRIVSRADGGIYDGMNRALAEAAGQFVMILNSDDLLPPGTVAEALAMIEANSDAGWISGSALFGTSLSDAVPRTNDAPLTAEGALFGIPAINARLFRRSLIERIGPIRDNIGLASDREFMARLARSGARGLAFTRPLYLYRVHEGSHTISGDAAGRLRVYDAERRLATALLAEPDDHVELHAFARASRALANGKMWMKGGSASPGIDELIDLARGAKLALRWRGRLSGY